MLSQKATSNVSLNPIKSKARGLIRVPQGKICRIAASDQDYDGLYTDDFLSCNIIVVHNKKRMSMIHADSSIDLAVIESEKKWVGEGANIKVFFKENGTVLYKQIFGIPPKIKPISERTKAISAKFVDGVGLVEALADKSEKTIRHPQENRLETAHKINVAFFYLLHPAYRFDEKTKIQWKEQISKVVFDAGFWVMPNAQACNLHTRVAEKITKFKNKSSAEIQAQIYQKRIALVQGNMDQMPENETIIMQEPIVRISVSVAETIWCYYNQHKLHDDVIDAKEINEAYTKIQHNRAKIQFNCQSIYESQSHDYRVTNFAIMRPFIKNFFCREESIVSELNNRNLPFIDFMEMRIKNSSLDEKQLLESFSSSIVPAEPCVVAATSKTAVSDAPAKLMEVLPTLENAVKTEHLGSEVPAKTEDLENKKIACQVPETPVLKPATNASPVTTTVQPKNTVVQAKNKAPILSDKITQKRLAHKAQEKVTLSDFPLIQAKKTETHDNKQENEGWLPAPTRKKPAPESRPNFLSTWEDTCAKGSLKKVVPLAPQVAGNRNKTIPLKDEDHFPALPQTKSSRKPNTCKIPD